MSHTSTQQLVVSISSPTNLARQFIANNYCSIEFLSNHLHFEAGICSIATLEQSCIQLHFGETTPSPTKVTPQFVAHESLQTIWCHLVLLNNDLTKKIGILQQLNYLHLGATSCSLQFWYNHLLNCWNALSTTCLYNYQELSVNGRIYFYFHVRCHFARLPHSCYL